MTSLMYNPFPVKKNNLELFGRVEDVELGLGLDGLLQGSEELLLEPEDLLDVAEQGAETKHKKKINLQNFAIF